MTNVIDYNDDMQVILISLMMMERMEMIVMMVVNMKPMKNMIIIMIMTYFIVRIMIIMIITMGVYMFSTARLMCEYLPTDGCVEWKFNDILNSYDKKVIGTPKEVDLFQWLAHMKLEDVNLKKLQGIMRKIEG